jgi:signal transduction histidine kinase
VTTVLVILLLVPWALYVETAAKDSAHVISLFGERGRSATEQVRTRYEQQIRQAAGQEERNRLARDLHDSIKQQIFVIQTAAATVQARFEADRDGARSAIEQVRRSAREAMAEMEAMLDQLRAAPLENNGLVEALKKQCEALEFRSGARVELKLGDLPPNESLAPGAHQAIFRVAQEALANIGRHARPKRVMVQLDAAGGNVRLAIQDDGSGFDSNSSPSPKPLLP